MMAPDLFELTEASQLRNGREGITGLMLYDNNQFFQWLEGPLDRVDRLMDSIRADRRHTSVEVLNKQDADMRTFAEWSMKLAAPGPASAAWKADVIEPPPEIVEGLRARPDAAPALLVKLVSVTAKMVESVPLDTVAEMPFNQKAASVLKNIFISAVVPQLSRAHAAPHASRLPSASTRAGELAELLVAADQASALDLIEEIQADGAAIGLLAATLFEPAARSLGDLWSEDFCSELDVTIGLCRLQAAVRLLTAGCAPRRPSRARQPIVLIAPGPGELHQLGAALDRTVLENAGWSPQSEYASDEHALDDVLAAKWFDVLDLTLSPAFRRESILPKLAETIAQARLASRNPGLVVVVGGRMFNEEKAAGLAVGADGSNASSLNVNRSILRTISATRSPTPEATPT